MRWTWWRPPCVLRTVIVNLKDDPNTALRGVLWETRAGWWVLRHASLLKTSTTPTPIDGDALVHRDNISFVQVVP